MFLINYLKCIWANKVTFVGMILSPTIFIFAYKLYMYFYSYARYQETDVDSYLAIWLLAGTLVATCLLLVTEFGFGTYVVYRATWNWIRKGGKNYEVSTIKKRYGSAYCYRVGLELALREHQRGIPCPFRETSVP